MATADGERPVPPGGMAACLFSLSFATVLFTLAMFQLLSFFIMPSLFFDLLFIGFPVGAFLGARFFPVSRAAFRRSLWLLQVVMAASVAASLLGKHFDYLRAHLFDVQVPQLLLQIGTFTALFVPFFVAYGLSEYLGYQLGRQTLGGRMRLVYALYLFGAAAAYLFLRWGLPPLGMARVLAIAFVGVAVPLLALGGVGSRAAVRIELLLLVVALALPWVEGTFLAAYKGDAMQSTSYYKAAYGCRTVFQKWGRYALCEVLENPAERSYCGFYNDIFQWEYAPGYGFSRPSLGMYPVRATAPGARLAIIGAGGGRQVRYAETLGDRRVVAVEIEPAVFEAVRSLPDAFGGVYEHPAVEPVRGEARGYLERSAERFDLIYVPSIGGYPQMMIEPGNMVRTFEAYRLMRERLTGRGMLAIWYPIGLDFKGILTDQYVRTLRALGMPTAAYRNAYDYLILAYRDPRARPPTPDEVLAHSMPPGREGRHEEWARQDPGFRPEACAVADDPSFVPITDEKPFLGGNVRYVLSLEQVYELFGCGLAVLAAAGLALLVGLRRRGDPHIPGRPYLAVAGLAFLFGANFLVIEHYLVLALFKRLFVYDDALTLGAVTFLLLSGLGSLVGTPRSRLVLAVLAVPAVGALLAFPDRLSANAVLVLIAPVALATGSFFPALFDLAARNPLAVFALDGIGAGFGALVASFVPIVYGFQALFAVAGAVFVAALVANLLFHRGLRHPAGDGPPAEARAMAAVRS